jgi:hypothetical protein
MQAERVPNIPLLKIKVEKSGPLRNRARRSSTEQTMTERPLQKQAIPKTSSPSKKASKSPLLSKIYKVEQAGTTLQGMSLKDSAIAIGMKYGFDLSK